MTKYHLIALLTFLIAVYSFGSASATADSQRLLAEQHNILHEQQNRQLEKMVKLQVAGLRGELWFHASFDDARTLTLRKTDGKSFSLANLTLAPAFQRSAAAGPEVGPPVRVNARGFYGHEFRIQGSDEKACEKVGEDICRVTLMRVFLEFEFAGRSYRVVAYHQQEKKN